MYIRLSDSHYPMTEAEIRAENPDTVFAEPFNPAAYDWVFPTPHPATTRLQTAREIAPVLDPVKLTWGQAWEVVDITVGMTTEQLQGLKNSIRDEKIAEICALHKQKLYTDIAATFPAGQAVIQFRDEIDRTNLSNMASGAMALVLGGTPTQIIPYRTLDNSIQQVPASDMVAIALGVIDAKQAIATMAWEHKDSVAALAADILKTPQDILNYDITAWW